MLTADAKTLRDIFIRIVTFVNNVVFGNYSYNASTASYKRFVNNAWFSFV